MRFFGQAAETRMFLASLQDDDGPTVPRKRRLLLKRQRRHYSLRVPNVLEECVMDASESKTLAAKLHRFTHQKWMKDNWKFLAQIRTLTTFTNAQLRQLFCGVAMSLHLLTRYSRRASHLQTQLHSVFFLVFLPFSVPPLLVLVVPTLFLLLPLLMVVLTLDAMNRQAKPILERYKQPPRGQGGLDHRRRGSTAVVQKSVFNDMSNGSTRRTSSRPRPSRSFGKAIGRLWIEQQDIAPEEPSDCSSVPDALEASLDLSSSFESNHDPADQPRSSNPKKWRWGRRASSATLPTRSNAISTAERRMPTARPVNRRVSFAAQVAKS